ncbi:interactor of constitutive active ROPs 2, chloroplastic [Tanacetum coccineum]
MQNPKTRGGSTGSAGRPKITGANRDNVSSRSLTTRSPKAIDNRSPRGPTSEKKRVDKVPELETELAQLQEQLKKTKKQLTESESCTKHAQQEAEEAKKQLAAMSAKLDESQQQLDELWACEESRIQELRKISQDRDRAWESELKAVQKHHSMDSQALAAVLNENQKLKIRLRKLVEAEEANDEVVKLKLELSETVDLVQELKTELNESKESETRALELVSQIKSSMKKFENDEAGRVLELASALEAKAELENELRRLKVQMEQWRKAAEVAAEMVLGEGGDGKFVEASDPLDFSVVSEKSNLPNLEDADDESSNKKTGNMLKKIGVMLKKGQKTGIFA